MAICLKKIHSSPSVSAPSKGSLYTAVSHKITLIKGFEEHTQVSTYRIHVCFLKYKSVAPHSFPSSKSLMKLSVSPGTRQSSAEEAGCSKERYLEQPR